MGGETYGSRALVVAFLLLFACLIQLFHWNDELLQRSEEKTLSSPMSTKDAPALDVTTFDILVEDTVSLDSSTSLLTSAETNSDLLIFPQPKVVQVGEGGGGGQRQQVLSIDQSLKVQIDVDMNEDGYDDNDASEVHAVHLIRSSVIRMSKRLRHMVPNTAANANPVVYVHKLYILLSTSPSSSFPQSLLSLVNDTQLWTSEEDYIIAIEYEDVHHQHVNHGATVKINAPSPRGITMAITTLNQILSLKQTVTSLPIYLYDYPKYAWRGLMIDVARHFIPLDALKKNIDGMELSKLNVLHLHLTDSQSFPVLLTHLPRP